MNRKQTGESNLGRCELPEEFVTLGLRAMAVAVSPQKKVPQIMNQRLQLASPPRYWVGWRGKDAAAAWQSDSADASRVPWPGSRLIVGGGDDYSAPMHGRDVRPILRKARPPPEDCPRGDKFGNQKRESDPPRPFRFWGARSDFETSLQRGKPEW